MQHESGFSGDVQALPRHSCLPVTPSEAKGLLPTTLRSPHGTPAGSLRFAQNEGMAAFLSRRLLTARPGPQAREFVVTMICCATSSSSDSSVSPTWTMMAGQRCSRRMRLPGMRPSRLRRSSRADCADRFAPARPGARPRWRQRARRGWSGAVEIATIRAVVPGDSSDSRQVPVSSAPAEDDGAGGENQRPSRLRSQVARPDFSSSGI